MVTMILNSYDHLLRASMLWTGVISEDMHHTRVTAATRHSGPTSVCGWSNVHLALAAFIVLLAPDLICEE